MASIIQLEEGWEKIKSHGLSILEDFLNKAEVRSFTKKEYSDLYTTVYNMCIQRTPHNWSEQLYTRYGESMSHYLIRTVLPALREKHDEYLLRELVKRWENHKIMVKWMKNFFSYLDRYYVKHHSLPSLQETGLKTFRSVVFEEVKRDVRDALIAIITREREGDMVDKTLLRSTVDIFTELGMGTLDVYAAHFEESFLQSTASFYSRTTRGWIAQDSCPEYLVKAEKCLTEEQARLDSYLHKSTETKLLREVEKEVLAQHQSTLLEKDTGIVWLLTNLRKDDLARLYRLFNRISEGLVPVAAAFRKHVTEMGQALVDSREQSLKSGVKENPQESTFVQSLLDLHDKYKGLVSECFGGNALFQRALKEAFESFINTDVGKLSNAELLSTFCDKILKKSGERITDERLEELLEKAVQLFTYLSDKDLFAEIYRGQLSKRLLNETSASDFAEKSMISKLKLRCGAQFTSKMEGMLTDLIVADGFAQEFRNWLQNTHQGPALPVELSVTVLTTGYWPTFRPVELVLPSHLEQCLNVFKTYYESRTSHRRLTWVYSLGLATVLGKWDSRRFSFICSTVQAIVLLAFNDVSAVAAAAAASSSSSSASSSSDGASSLGPEWVSFSALQAFLGLSEDIAKRMLHSLSCGKFKIIEKSPPDTKTVAPTDSFRVNPSFQSQMLRIKIPMPPMDEVQNKERVQEDRSIAIEAAVVRIMKSRKSMAHVQLVSEVLQQLSFFKPNPKVIKQRIEHLIEREYLERDANQPNVYKYLA